MRIIYTPILLCLLVTITVTSFSKRQYEISKFNNPMENTFMYTAQNRYNSWKPMPMDFLHKKYTSNYNFKQFESDGVYQSPNHSMQLPDKHNNQPKTYRINRPTVHATEKPQDSPGAAFHQSGDSTGERRPANLHTSQFTKYHRYWDGQENLPQIIGPSSIKYSNTVELTTFIGALSFASFVLTLLILLGRSSAAPAVRSTFSRRRDAAMPLEDDGSSNSDYFEAEEEGVSEETYLEKYAPTMLVRVPKFVHLLGKIFSPVWYVKGVRRRRLR